MTPCRILIAGIGNIFLGDDAFGVEVAQQLMKQELPPDVRVVDFGIRGLDLTYALLDGCDAAILVDAVPRGGTPGTLYVIEPDMSEAAVPPQPGDVMIDTHNMDPVKVLRLVGAMGGHLSRLLVIGCEPCKLPDDEDPNDNFTMEMSPAVRMAVDQAVPLIESLVANIIKEENAKSSVGSA